MAASKILAILESHLDYAESLAGYLESRTGFPYETVLFTDYENYLDYENENRVEVLLCEEDTALGHASEFNPHYFAVLTDYYEDKTISGHPSIFKYQSAEEIIKRINELCTQQDAVSSSESAGKKAKVYGVCSPSGGSCKSTLALAMALRQSKKERTLFLSFDPFYNIPGTKKEVRDQSLSDIIYYLKQNPGNLHDIIRMVTKRQSSLDYVMGVAHWVDLMEITGSDVKELMEEIIHNMSYDSVIIDVGMFSTISMDMLRYCDRIFVPTLGNNGLELEKAKEWKRQIKFIGGEKLLSRMTVVAVPVDNRLSGEGYSIEAIESGKIGKFAEKLNNEAAYACT